jgi:hypothetical protein
MDARSNDGQGVRLGRPPAKDPRSIKKQYRWTVGEHAILVEAFGEDGITEQVREAALKAAKKKIQQKKGPA